MFEEIKPNVPLFQLVYRLVKTVLAGVLWTVCCIPVITAGAATTALYDTIVKTVRHDRGTVLQTFFRSFKDNFKVATAVTLLLLGYFLVLVLGIVLAAQLSQATGSAFFAPYLAGAAGLPVVLVLPYLFPLLARFEYSVKSLLISAFSMSIRHFASTVLFWVLMAGAVILSVRFPQYTMAVPGLMCLVLSIQMEKLFRPLYERNQNVQEGEEPPWYLE